MKRIISILFLLFMISSPVHAIEDIRTPSSKNVVYFHPTHFAGEGIDIDQYIGDNGQRYGPIRMYVQQRPAEDPKWRDPKVNIETFRTILNQEIGILYIGGHSNPSRILVETYDTYEYAQERLKELLKVYEKDEVVVWELEVMDHLQLKKYGTIVVTENFIRKYANLKGNTIVFVASCNPPLQVFVDKGARVAVGPDNSIQTKTLNKLTGRFFQHLNGNFGRDKRTVEIAVTDIGKVDGVGLAIAGNGKTVLNPTVIVEKTGGAKVQNGQKIIAKFDSTIDFLWAYKEIFKVDGAELEGITWPDRYTLEATLKNIQKDTITVTVVAAKVSSNQNPDTHLDGNTNPPGINGMGPAHDDYVKIFSENFADYGDAPAPYPKARHFKLDYEWLGDKVDGELKPNEDDKDDGIDIQYIGNKKLKVSFTITTSGDVNRYNKHKLFVNGWFDWNRNGKWENGELTKIWNGVPDIYPSFSKQIEIDIPQGSNSGKSWARFRLGYGAISEIGDATKDTYAGEVEDWDFMIHNENEEITGGECLSCHQIVRDVKGSSLNIVGLGTTIIFLIIISIFRFRKS